MLTLKLLNEPGLGDFYSRPHLLLPQRNDRDNLAPMYKRLNAEIRAVDERHIVMFEPTVIVSNLPLPLVGDVGFDGGPGGADLNDRQGVSFHLYCAAQDASGQPRSDVLCSAADAEYLKLKLKVHGKSGPSRRSKSTPSASAPL
jgi:hypothetical protein